MPHCVAGKQLRHGCGQQMRRAVAVERAAPPGSAVGDDADAASPLERVRQIDQPAVDRRRERGFGEARRDDCRNVAGSGARAHATARSVG